jgi:phage portal protein BeeE
MISFKAARQRLAALLPRWGGDGHDAYSWLLPGSRYDYATEAGDVWANSVVAIMLQWLGDRYARPRHYVARIDRKGEYQPIPAHPAALLWERPNPFMTRRVVERSIGNCLKVDGYAYLQKVRNGAGHVVELWPIPNHRCKPRWSGNEYIGGYVVTVDGAGHPLDASDIIMFRDGIDPRNERLGYSALKACLREVCTINEESGYTASILRNSGVPGLMITPEDPALRPSTDDAKRIKERIGDEFGGDKRGGTVVMQGKYKVTTVGFSPEQLSLKELPNHAMARLAAATGVPLMATGLPDPGKTYTNVESAIKIGWNSVCAVHERIGEALRWDLFPEFATDPRLHAWQYDYSEVAEMAEAEDDKHARAREDFKYGVLTLNEARESLGLDADPDGDRYFPGTGDEEEPYLGQPGKIKPTDMPSANDEPMPTMNGKAARMLVNRGGGWTPYY